MALSLSGEGRETLAFGCGVETFTPGPGVGGRFIFRSLGEAAFYPSADAVVAAGWVSAAEEWVCRSRRDPEREGLSHQANDAESE
jgi:hypothetical protein